VKGWLLNLSKKYTFNLLGAALLLGWLCLYNGYPILYPDSATYIKSGFALETPPDRPITYSLFILLSSFYNVSLFLTVFLQNLLLAWLLLEVFLKCLRRSALPFFLPVIAILSACTGVSWVSNQIFADLFTSFIFLSSYLIITYTEQNRKKLYMIQFIFLLSVASHLSHITISELFLICILPPALLILSRMHTLSKPLVLRRIASLICLALASVLSMGSALSKSGPVFFTGKLCENGILKKYLEDCCPTAQYKLCAYTGELSYPAIDFVWSKQGATNKLGGWNAVRDEYAEIDSRILHSPKYLQLFVKESVKASLAQCVMNDAGEGNEGIRTNENLLETHHRYFGSQDRLLKNSRQFRETIPYNRFNALYVFFNVISLFSFCLLFLRKCFRKEADLLLFFCLLVLIGIGCNNILGASLANAVNRFGLRVIWMLPFSVLLMGVEIISRTGLKPSET
jgi:hypothetical protein